MSFVIRSENETNNYLGSTGVTFQIHGTATLNTTKRTAQKFKNLPGNYRLTILIIIFFGK